MECFGYYIVKPMPKPKWCTLNTSKILTISEGGLSYKFPDLAKCFWINYPHSDREQYAKYLGCEILGSEMLGDGYFGFFSYIENSLNEVLDRKVNLLIDNQTDLILNTYEETKQFSNMVQGMGEPVIWTPFEIYEYDVL